MNTCTSRPTARARSTLRCPAGRRVSPKSDNRAGRSTSPGSSRSRAQAPSTRSAGSGTPIRARSRRQSSACHTPSAGTPPSSPRAQARTISGRCKAYRSKSSARCRTALNRRARRRRIHVVAGAAQMRRQARQPRLPQTPIHHLEQSPNRPLRQPRIRIRLDPRRRRHRIPDEPARRREVDVRAHPITPPIARPEPIRHPLREPPLHPARRHGDDLRDERISHRIDEKCTERLDQSVSPLGSMDMEHVGESAWHAARIDRTAVRHHSEGWVGGSIPAAGFGSSSHWPGRESPEPRFRPSRASVGSSPDRAVPTGDTGHIDRSPR